MGNRKRTRRLRRGSHPKRGFGLLRDLAERLYSDSGLQQLLAAVTVEFVGPAAATRDILDRLASDLRNDSGGITLVLDDVDRVPEDEQATEKPAATATEEITRPPKRLKPCEKEAYEAYEHACGELRYDARNKEAYEWLQEYGLAEYDLPQFESWIRYLSAARRYHGTQRKKPRAGRIGRSVVRQDQVEADFITEECGSNGTAGLRDRLQGLEELAGDLYFSEDGARRGLWEKIADNLWALGVEQSRIDSIVSNDDPEELAEIIESFRQRGEYLPAEY